MTNEEAIAFFKDMNECTYGNIEAVEMAIKALEQQPKTGHWEYVQYDGNRNIGNWHCSECRGICTEIHSIEDAYEYCPNCGTKMEESEDKE